MGNTLLEMKGITKRFPGVVALNNVSMKINSGEVLAVVGENGAGKSTLIKIMSGAYQQDEGQVLFEGQDQGKLVPARALELGITAIYQELTNVKGLSIAENIFRCAAAEERTDRLQEALCRQHGDTAAGRT